MTTSPASFVSPDDVQRVAANLADVRRRTERAGGDPANIAVVAVTKNFGTNMVLAAHAVGLRAVGENYVDELEVKRAELSDLDVAWHYLGALQSNKIARVLRVADVVSGVSRAKEIRLIAAQRPGATIDVQVDLTGAPARNGADAADVGALVDLARISGLEVRGLMTVASPDAARASQQFARVNELCVELGVAERSMGMSDDLELAIAQGSTEIRIGRALFGPRPTRTPLT
ncbi:MAG TPA: alanine racemase [Acidimicrobiales bacterium]